MKTLVAMVKATGDLCCLTPLYPDRGYSVKSETDAQWTVWVDAGENKPMAYACDFDLETCPLLNADLVNEYVEILGEL